MRQHHTRVWEENKFKRHMQSSKHICLWICILKPRNLLPDVDGYVLSFRLEDTGWWVQLYWQGAVGGQAMSCGWSEGMWRVTRTGQKRRLQVVFARPHLHPSLLDSSRLFHSNRFCNLWHLKPEHWGRMVLQVLSVLVCHSVPFQLRTGSRALDLLRVTLLHQCYDALVPW